MSSQFVPSAPSDPEAISKERGSPPPKYHHVQKCRYRTAVVFQCLMIIAIIFTIAFVVYNSESVESLKKINGGNSQIISKLWADVKEGKGERDRDLERFQTIETSYDNKFKNMEINFEAIEEEIYNRMKAIDNNFQTVEKKMDKLCEIVVNCEIRG